ncbi:cation/multidrug efflux pump [Thioflavicoccus mobilis 8321]|uniref:Cation/multidrug efflux pump n=1 Tax=Thioflavicoccus mobilis 8321 TaxID=765912 RepID=L0GYT4_9GAMM|nr:efflux RND transporter permease subunit [Thioflavicoccus mobilis]AGA90977.1 cation/multidrug efflux pump [Thioflavicoccus mobilis 8321]
MTQDDHHSKAAAADVDLSAEHLGLAGRTARSFIHSPLSPLFYFSMLLMGVLGLMLTPRQEDPQISVPMIDIMVQYPGASAQQVSNIAMQPLERIMSEIPGIKHVYSASERGQGIVTVEFDVGQQMGPSLVKVNDKISSNLDKIPPGVMPPLVKSKGIDDVPIVTVTLWSRDIDEDGLPDVDDGQLRLLAQDVLQALKEVKNTGSGFIVGGRREQLTVDVYPARLSSYQISLDQVAQTIRTANAEETAGGVESSGSHFSVTTGAFLRGAEDIERLVVGTRNEVPVYVRDVARVTRGPEDAEQLVAYYTGPAAEDAPEQANGEPAVTVAIAKKELTNGVTVANAIIDRLEELKGTRIPNNVAVSITRNYGETADEKVSELIFKLFVATGWVFLLVWIAFRALRPAFVVLLVIPVVLLMTIFVAWVADYTIDRVSLFALIFSIGILVDDAIVVVENIYRRWLEQGRLDEATAVDAVREVGNPTILATFTVIAALLPMGFVSGMMGPYMEPIPALGSVAMLISLFAAFVFTPYLAISGPLRPSMRYLETAEKREYREAEALEGFFRRLLTPLIEDKRKRRLFRLVLWGTFAFALSFFYFTWVPVKMLPLDNKPEFSVVIDLPDGTALPVTANLVHRMAETVRGIPEVTAVQLYTGTARPFDFNGMVRHYYLRSKPWQGELQVQLTDKDERKRSSHEIAVEAREKLTQLIEGTGARIAVVEMPPGPPVLQSVVAEIHGPTPEVRRQFARDMTEIFERAESTADVDNYLRTPYDYWRFEVDTEKAVRRGISVDVINRNLAMALGGEAIGDIKRQAGHEPVKIVLQVPLAERSQVERLGDLPVQSSDGFTIPLRELGTFRRMTEEDIIYRKDLRAIEYVVSDVGGKLAAPVYAMLQIEDIIEESGYKAPDGVMPQSYWTGPPPSGQESAWEWTGEWTVTYETFRDMGAAFVVALLLIYILVVWEFGSFRIPLVIMAPIPLTLLGIIPAHFLAFQLGFGGEFTATSMIGWIALAGIIVRNSILLVDFSIHEIQKGVPVAEAVIRACKTRTRPILITALALVAGSSVIFTDPIFQGMAISLASGVLVSTILTLIVIPLGCVAKSKDMCAVAQAKAPPGVTVPCDLEEHTRAKTASTHPSAIARLVGKLGEIGVLILYGIRGIFLLLFDVLKGFLKRRRKATPRPPSPPSAPPSRSSGGGGGSASGGESPTASSAPAPGARDSADQAPSSDDGPRPAKTEPAAAPASPQRAEASAVEHGADEQAEAESAETEKAPDRTASEPAKASTPRKRPAQKGDAPKRSPSARKRSTTKSTGDGEKAGTQTSRTATKATPKRPARRGIRLKDDDPQDPNQG